MGERRQHHPGIDGLRGVAVLQVLVFHGGLGWMPGGFLGVSVFFTLSGFLITGLLVDEVEQHGRLSYRRFWGRRLRRLAPAGLACLAVVAVAGPRLAVDVAASVRADVLASLAYVANWRFVWSHHSYADLFAAPSPVQHFWSLAIEEQFYVVLPLLVGVIAWARGRRRAVGWVMLCLLVGSVLLTRAIGSPDRVYYGTDTRAAELLVGGVMACLVGRRLRQGGERSWRTDAVSVGGLVSLVAIVGLSASTHQSDQWLSNGGLAAFALLSAVAVAAAIVPGPTRRLLSCRPLVGIGAVSYGLYLYHWPLFVWLTPARLGFGGVGRFALLLALTAGLAGASYRFLEQPVRTRRALRRPEVGLSAFVAAAVAVLLVAVVVPLPRGGAVAGGLDGSAGPVLLAPTTVPPPTTTGGSGAVTTSTVPPPPVVLVLGSDGELGAALRTWGFGVPIRIVDRTTPQCPIFRTDAVPGATPSPEGCPDFRTTWVDAVAEVRPDLVVIAIGRMERSAYALGGVPASASLRRDETAAAMRLAAGFEAPVVVNDSFGTPSDVVSEVVRTAADEDGPAGLRAVFGSTPTPELVDVVSAVEVRGGEGEGLPRVLVIGDSTAQSVAQGLFDGADGRLEVVAAGVIGCPVVDTDAVRPHVGEERDTAYCPSMGTDLPRWLDAYQPDLVLLVAGAAEQWPQRYRGDPAWYLPGSAEYVRRHAALVEDLMGLLVPRRTPLVVLESPVIDVGLGGLGGDEASRSAWNQVLASWDGAWLPVAELPYARYWSDPTTSRGRAERPDGVHPDHAVMERLARDELVPQLLATEVRLRSEMAAAGCTGAPDLGPCRS